MSRTGGVRECGTAAKYKHGGCRCDACKSAQAEVSRIYRERHADDLRARKLAYSEKNREKEAERARRWYAENKERAKENVKAWQIANRDKFLDHKRSEGAKRRLMPGAVFQPGIDYRTLWTGCCGICGKLMDDSLPRGDSASPTIDHIIPLNAGGDHTVENLQWAHMGCNAGKGPR